jgi:hypothetical protein
MEEINGIKNVRRTDPEDVKHPSNISLQGCQKASSSQSTTSDAVQHSELYLPASYQRVHRQFPREVERLFLTVPTLRISPFKRLCGFMERTDHQKGMTPVART